MAIATYPSVVVYADNKKTKIQHLLFGDWIKRCKDDNGNYIEDGDWIKIRCRGVNGWIKKHEIEDDSILEINIVDVGQGDGCFIITPENKFILVDAGKTDNMHRFLSWRFNLRYRKPDKPPIKFESAIISHSDLDHYGGFGDIFKDDKIIFDNVYHNGIVERVGDYPLGETTKVKGKKYIKELIKATNDLKPIITDPQKVGKKRYLKVLLEAWNINPKPEFTMLDKSTKYIPGYDANNNEVQMEILGPVTETHDGKKMLKYFKDKGKTKNGHSVIIRLKIKDLRILLGGDLNISSEDYIMHKYSGEDVVLLKKKLHKAKSDEERKRIEERIEKAVKKSREFFECEIAKACHHGSHHFTSEFLRSVNPIATIVSSGDNEGYAHPRPDALGTFGKCGRGERPLIFSTELARSANENIKNPYALRNKVLNLIEEYDAIEEGTKKKERLNKKITKELENIERSIAIYGLINIRTDGNRTIIAQKLERPRSKGAKYDIHEIIKENGEFKYKIKLKH